MAPVRIVPAFDKIKDRKRGFALILEPMPNEQLALKRRVEALAHRIIEAITNGAHRRLDAGFAATPAKRDRRVLAALV